MRYSRVDVFSGAVIGFVFALIVAMTLIACAPIEEIEPQRYERVRLEGWDYVGEGLYRIDDGPNEVSCYILLSKSAEPLEFACVHLGCNE